MAHFLERKMRPLGETYSKSVRPLGLGRLTLVHPSPKSGSGDDLCTQYTPMPLTQCCMPCVDHAFDSH